MSIISAPSPDSMIADALAPAPTDIPCLALESDCLDPEYAKHLRIAAVFIILAASSIGIWLPYIAGTLSLVHRESNLFLVIKAFGAGVILATGFIHMFPSAMDSFGNQCLGWPGYPWAALIAVITIVVVLFLEHLVSSAYERRFTRQLVQQQIEQHAPRNPEDGTVADGVVPELDEKALAQRDARIRSFAIAQVLEAGIAFHSVLIGIALGVSNSPCTIRPLLAALTFHQMFEGIALGSCLLQAEFTSWAYAAMALIFAITTPVGVAIGIGIQSSYNATSVTNLIVSGTFDSISTGILIYMALVDLIATDFTSKRFRNSLSLQAGSYVCLLLGIGCMAVLAIWA